MIKSFIVKLFLLLLSIILFYDCSSEQLKAKEEKKSTIFGHYSSDQNNLSFTLNIDSTYYAKTNAFNVFFVDTGNYFLKGDTLRFRSRLRSFIKNDQDDPTRFEKFLDSIAKLHPGSNLPNPMDNSLFITKGDSLYDPLFYFSLKKKL